MDTAEDWLRLNIIGPHETIAGFATKAFNAGVEAGKAQAIQETTNVIQDATKENRPTRKSADGQSRGDISKRFAERIAGRKAEKPETKAGKRQVKPTKKL